jgi:hypothetical protein
MCQYSTQHTEKPSWEGRHSEKIYDTALSHEQRAFQVKGEAEDQDACRCDRKPQHGWTDQHCEQPEPRVVKVKGDTLALTACIRHMLVKTGKVFQEGTACSYVEAGWILC